MRSHLGKFQIQGTDAIKPMMMLSGGQKSRVAFASLSYQKPHVIIMDEPWVPAICIKYTVKCFHFALYITLVRSRSFFWNTAPTTWIWKGEYVHFILYCLLLFTVKISLILALLNVFNCKSIDALVDAVKDFRGGLIVVSHDQHFITNTCGELWVVGGGKVARFRGDFNDYKKETLSRTAKRVADSVKSLSAINN